MNRFQTPQNTGFLCYIGMFLNKKNVRRNNEYCIKNT